MSKPTKIIEEKIVVRNRKRKEAVATLSIWSPSAERDGAWTCRVRLGNLWRTKIYGATALQALFLAIADLRLWLEREEKQGVFATHSMSAERLLPLLERWWASGRSGREQPSARKKPPTTRRMRRQNEAEGGKSRAKGAGLVP